MTEPKFDLTPSQNTGFVAPIARRAAPHVRATSEKTNLFKELRLENPPPP
jgi:hypothetical protein